MTKRIFLLLLMIGYVLFLFWTGSRYPELNMKANMSDGIDLSSLGFDVVLPVEDHDPIWKKVVYTGVNWLDTNKKGMTFGVILAGLVMTLLTQFPKLSSKNPFLNSLGGTVTGVPLGVCVNCAAPIAAGLKMGGARTESSLATMISSPTLNVLVVSMTFTMLPWYMAWGKIVMAIAVAVIAVPILVRYVFRIQDEAVAEGVNCELPQMAALPMAGSGETWLASIRWVLVEASRSLARMIRLTVPWMFAAAFLGGALIILLPWNAVLHFLPEHGMKLVFGMMVLAAIGVFLPVPMTFDVLLAVTLFQLGVPEAYVMTLLFTLGAYSVYSFVISYQQISRPAAVALIFVVWGAGVAGGCVIHKVAQYDRHQQSVLLTEQLAGQSLDAPQPVSEPESFTLAEIMAEHPVEVIQPQALDVRQATDDETSEVSVSGRPLNERGTDGSSMFTLVNGDEVGLFYPHKLTVRKLMYFFSDHMRGISCGDVHNDGWVDVLTMPDFHSSGLMLFSNRNGLFVRQRLDLGEAGNAQMCNAALVDLNNDGWLDVFFATYEGDVYVYYSDEGKFENGKPTQLFSYDGACALAVAFGDLNQDGQIDIALGMYSVGWTRERSLESSRNRILYREGDGYRVEVLPGIPQETNAMLISDFNQDGYPDLIVGNDWASDTYYLGAADGSLRMMCNEEGIIPHTANGTMTIHTADLDNDLVLELFVAQTSQWPDFSDRKKMLRRTDLWKAAEGHANMEELRRDIRTMDLAAQAFVNPAKGLAIEDARDRMDAVTLGALNTAIMRKDRKLLNRIRELRPDLEILFRRITSETHEITEEEKTCRIPVKSGENHLYYRGPDGAFQDRAREAGLAFSEWSWNGRFADVDHDGLQDIYIVNGKFLKAERESNYFFRNAGAGRFENMTETSGLKDPAITGSYIYIDYDNDGDLDIISAPINAPTRLFVNNTGDEKRSIVIRVKDHTGNHFGIGAMVTVAYGDGSTSARQLREIQASGGFVAFEAPMAHFGLGETAGVAEIVVRWPDGAETKLTGEFPADHAYIIERRRP